MLNRIAELPLPLMIVALVLPFIGLVTVAYFVVIQPVSSDLDELRLRLQREERNLLQMKEGLAGFQEPPEAEKARWKKVEKEFNTKIPREKDLLGLIQDLSSIAAGLGIKDISILLQPGEKEEEEEELLKRPAPPPPTAGPGPAATFPTGAPQVAGPAGKLKLLLKKVRIKAEFHAPYKTVAYFIDEIGKLDRAVELVSIKIERDLPMIDVTLVLQSYFAPNFSSI